MAEILGLGLSHYPPLCPPDADMAGIDDENQAERLGLGVSDEQERTRS